MAGGRASGKRLALALLAVILLAGAATGGWILRQRQLAERELVLKQQLRTLGVLLPGSVEHVQSVLADRQKLDAASKLDQATELIGQLPYVTIVNLSDTPLTDAQLARIASCSRLVDLALNGTDVTDEGLRHLRGMSRLENLHLKNTPITTAGLAHLRELESLTVLDLSGTNVADGFQPLLDLPNLQHLLIDGLAVKDEHLLQLANIPQLRRLTLDEEKVSEKARSQLQQRKPELSID